MKRMLLAAALAAATVAGAAAQTDAPADGAVPLRAQLRAVRSTTLAAGLSAALSQLPVNEGDQVKSGALIATLDCSTQRATQRVAESKVQAAEAKARVNERLLQLSSVSILDVELARAELAIARAELGALVTVLKKCEVHAPFAGIVVSKSAQAHQYVREGDPIVELVDTGELEIELVAPARWLAWLKPDTRFEIAVDDGGPPRAAKVVRIGGRVDPVSQTVRVLGRIEGASAGLLPGMSGIVRFPAAPAGR